MKCYLTAHLRNSTNALTLQQDQPATQLTRCHGTGTGPLQGQSTGMRKHEREVCRGLASWRRTGETLSVRGRSLLMHHTPQTTTTNQVPMCADGPYSTQAGKKGIRVLGRCLSVHAGRHIQDAQSLFPPPPLLYTRQDRQGGRLPPLWTLVWIADRRPWSCWWSASRPLSGTGLGTGPRPQGERVHNHCHGMTGPS